MQGGKAYKAFMEADSDERWCCMQPGILHTVKSAPQILGGRVLQLPSARSGPKVSYIESHDKVVIQGRKKHAAVATLGKRLNLWNLGVFKEQKSRLISQLHSHEFLVSYEMLFSRHVALQLA